jgi:PAS domain S-box-containing protein
MLWLTVGLGGIGVVLLTLSVWLWARLKRLSAPARLDIVEVIGLMPSACVVISEAGQILAMNRVAITLFGFNPTGESVTLLAEINPDNASELYQYRATAKRQSGQAFPALISSQHLSDLEVSILSFQEVQDDTPLRQKVNELSDKAALLDVVPVALLRSSGTGLISWANRAMTELSGYSLKELQGRKIESVLLDDMTDPQLRRKVQGAMLTRKPFTFETTRYHLSGEPYQSRVDLRVIDGSSHEFLISEQDVSPYKAQITALEAERYLTQEILATIQQGIIVLDEHHSVRYVNPALAALMGLSPETILRQTSKLTALPVLRELLTQLESVTEVGEFEMTVSQPDAKDISLMVHAAPRLQGDSVKGVIAVATDISIRKQVERDLTTAKETAEQATRIQRDFLSRMSHELRTPLNAILGFAQLLELDTLTDEQQVAVDRILNAGRHLLTLINEVLDLTRIELWGVSLATEPVAVPQLVEAALEIILPQSKAQRLSVHHEHAADPPRVYADANRLKQVLINLLSNAVKYNRDHGSVMVRYTLFSHQVLRVAVTDTGIGIASDKLHRLFTPFDRLDMEHSGIEGSGVGLSLCQRLIESMGGEIGVESEAGKGSTFWIDLPCEAAQTATPAVTLRQPREAERMVLYLDEHLSQLELLESLARRVGGIRIISAMQGSLGLELSQQERPALIILDSLPAMSNLEFVLQLNAQVAAPPPIIALVSQVDTASAERLKAVCSVLYKPLDIKTLAGIFEQLMTDSRQVATPERYVQPILVDPAEAAGVLRRTQQLLQRFNPEPSQRMHYELFRESIGKHLADLVTTNKFLWHQQQDLEESNLEMLERLSHIAEFRDDKTGLHTRRIGNYAAQIAARLGFDAAYAHMLSRAAPLHDIGKIGIADTILLKPGRLSDEEQQVARTHSTIGATLLSGGTTPLLITGQVIAESHHENWDGSGYPYNLAKDDIPIAGRIVAVADVYDTLTHERPYKQAWNEQEALEYLLTERNQKFDSKVVDAFVAVLREDTQASG